MTKSRGINGPRWKWQPWDVELLRRYYADHRTDDLAAAIGCSLQQCYRKAAQMGLLKSKEFLQGDDSGRIRVGERPHGGQFRPGMMPWNKGLKGSTGQHPNTVANHFKPGNKPHTWVPVGSTRITPDGYLHIKLTDTGYPPRDWQGYHRWVWEQAHGPIPSGHVVVFRGGQRTAEREQITLDRLECISRRENMRRNSLHTQYPPELVKVTQLRAALSRQINRRAKEAE